MSVVLDILKASSKTGVIPTALIIDLYPISFGDLSYSLWVVGEEVPRLGTFFEDFLVGVEDRISLNPYMMMSD